MPDKFQDTFPVPISFISGEQPSAAKLTAWAAQTNAALDKVERALGDMHASFHPLFSSVNTPIPGWAYGKGGTLLSTADLHLQILNLARLVGPAAALNPRILSGVLATITGEPLPSDSNEFYLRFIPDGSLTFSLAGTKFATYRATPDLVAAYGDYYFDPLTGKVVVWDGGGSNGTVTYDTDTTGTNMADTYYGAGFNVFPGPQQSIKCSVSSTSTGGQITLPILTDQQADWGSTSSTLTAQNDINYQVQLSFPTWLTAEYIAGDVIADGLLGLWDNTESRLVPGAFEYVSSTVVDYIGEELIAGNARYSIILAGGTDLTRTVDALRANHREHQHDGTNMDMRISHGNLSESAVGWALGGVGSENYSFFDNDDGLFRNLHPQYLGKWGFDSSVDRNALLGNILFASGLGNAAANTPAVGVTPPLFGFTEDSWGIFFGDSQASDPFLHWSSSTGGITLWNSDFYIEDNQDYKFVTPKTSTVTIPGVEFTIQTGWDEADSGERVEIIEDAGASWPDPTVKDGSPGFTKIITQSPSIILQHNYVVDINRYVADGGSVSKIELEVEANDAGTDVANVAVITYAFGGFASPTIVSDTRQNGIGSSRQVLTFNVTPTVINHDDMNACHFTVQMPSSPNSFKLYAARLTFTHDTVKRGG